jgi:hypothetical protein
MAKITIAQLPTSDSYINELTATEMDATKGGLADNLSVGGISVGDVLSGNNVTAPVTTAVSAPVDASRLAASILNGITAAAGL